MGNTKQMTGKICLVDDYPTNLFVLQEYLSDYKTKSFNNALDCIEYVKKFKPKLVLMDVKMPEMDGLEATKIIKNINPDTKVIGISGLASLEDIDTCHKSGMCCVITKPIDRDLLIEKINLMTQSVVSQCS